MEKYDYFIGSGDSHASLSAANIALWNWGTARGKVRELLGISFISRVI